MTETGKPPVCKIEAKQLKTEEIRVNMMRGRTYIFLAVLAAAMLLWAAVAKAVKRKGRQMRFWETAEKYCVLFPVLRMQNWNQILEKYARQENIR